MLIGINGFKGSGKDTVADYLVENYDFEKLAFADKLKDGIAAQFGITREQIEELKNDPLANVTVQTGSGLTVSEMSFRTMLKRYGTEVGREVFGWDFWVDILLPTMGHSHIGKRQVISDCRFENEMTRIKEWEGSVIRIDRPNTYGEDHASEQYPPPHLIDYTIDNDGNLEDLYEKVEDALVYLPGISGTST